MSSWIENTGICPVGLEINDMIEAYLVNGERICYTVNSLAWDISGSERDIAWWRKQSEQSLETAYDVPPKSSLGVLSKDQIDSFVAKLSDNPLYYTSPTTKGVIVKKSIYELAIEVLQNTTGKIYREHEIAAIVSIVDCLKALENNK